MAETDPTPIGGLTRPTAIDDAFHFFAHLRTTTRECALLETLGPADSDTARYSFVGAVPADRLVARRGRSWLERDGVRTEADWKNVLDRWCPLGTPPTASGPVQTGAIGYIGFDANPASERRTTTTPADADIPECVLVRYDVVLVVDRLTGTSTWAFEPCHDPTVARLESAWERWRNEPAPVGELSILGDVEPDFDREAMLNGVARAIEYIEAGDIFQANITGRFVARYEGDLFAAYAVLRTHAPNPFFAFLDFEDPILSTSPERFFQATGATVHSRPIKGTARHSIGGVDQRDRLLASAKDRAENVMIVDVVRNDLGRVCSPGTIRVDALCEAKRFNQLYHLESTVAGELVPGVGTTQLLGALFPPASVSGAPKLRALEVIEEIESVRRGPYCGAIGFFGSAGWIDTSVAIRVMYGHGDRAFMHAGGGIVADSNPDSELDELHLKAEGLLRVTESFNVLGPLRAAIDAADDRLFTALSERFAAVSEIARLKRRHGISSLQQLRVESMIAAREKQIAERGDLPIGLVGELYEMLVRHAMALQDIPPSQ